MVMTSLPVPVRTGALWPTRSPARGNASPEREIRAPTTTEGNRESFISGDMALLSSRVKVNGRSLTLRLRMANGMRGPCSARAKTNSVSPGAALAASAADSCTVPLTCVAAATGGAASVSFAGPALGMGAVDDVIAVCPAAARACCMLPSSPLANSLPGWASGIARPQKSSAALKSLRSNAALPASASALRFFGSSCNARAVSLDGSPTRLCPCSMASTSA